MKQYSYTFMVLVLASALCVVSYFWVFHPTTVTVVQRPKLPAKPTLAQIKHELENVRTVQEDYLVSPDGRPFYCAVSDSTFSPDDTKNIKWQVRWCWELSKAEVVALANQPSG